VSIDDNAAGDVRVAERPTDVWARRISFHLSRLVRVVSRHWLALVNLFMGLYVGLPILSPVLYHLGHAKAGYLVQTVFRPFCHQRPERSFFLFGEQMVYSYEELVARLGEVPSRYVGDADLGYKVAVCERDVALYGALVAFGILFHFVRRRLRPLSMRQFLLFILPLAVDGTGQLFGLWTSTWVSRVVTGAFFGLGCVWLVYPYLQQGMDEVHQEVSETPTHWAVNEGSSR